MTKETKDLIRRALHNHRSDNYERAEMAFSRCTPEQMQHEYGQSGQTRQAILDGYKEHFDAVNAALREVEALGETR